ncbi:MAG: hypothetical protein RLZZ524_1304 [Pseudomonadota bacterium]|jgi:hypothetical protein
MNAMKATPASAPRGRLASLGRLLLQGLSGPACQQAMQAHTPQPAEVLQAWMLASIDDPEGWSRSAISRLAKDRPAHAVHLQGAHA